MTRLLLTHPRRMIAWFLILVGSAQAATVEEALKLPDQWKDKVLNEHVSPHWLPDGESFWYQRKTSEGKDEFVLIQAGKGERKVSSTREGLSLPALVSRRTSKDGLWATGFTPMDTPPVRVTFVNQWKEELELFWFDHYGKLKSQGRLKAGEKVTKDTFKDSRWWIEDPKTKKAFAVMVVKDDGEEIIIDGPSPPEVTSQSSATSRDKQWSVSMKGNRVSLRNLKTKEVLEIECVLPAKAAFMGSVSWSPDSHSFVVPAVVDVTRPKLTLVESSPEGSVKPKVKVLDYFRPGDTLPKAVPVLFHVSDKKGIVVSDALFPNPYATKSNLAVRWSPTSSEFYFDYNQRGHQLYRIIGVNASSGEARIVVEETSKTFIDYIGKSWQQLLSKTGELLWLSERDGWAHLWLYDVVTGKVKQQVTSGSWIVRKVLWVDEAQRQVWFMACGVRPSEDPYHEHLCRVNLDGSGFVQLTEGDGDHRVQFSPNKHWFMDTFSRTDAAPIMELRLSKDGSKVCDLERADAKALLATGWQMPERFSAKGRDGKTDIYGHIIKPSDFDPTKKYPVVERVYAGPTDSWVPKGFDVLPKQHQIADLGFIIVQADGMGTNGRSKAFQDVCYKNAKDAGFPDRIAWIKAAAQTRPWMDLTRVGIYGGSAGGQNAMRALLDHNDFYQIAHADCGCHDNRLNMMPWNESFMGWPVDESYALSSNVLDAHKLQGHLLLTVGELDSNVDPASTMQVVNALQQAGKSFEFMPITGAGHCIATPFATRLRMEFLSKYLLKKQP